MNVLVDTSVWSLALRRRRDDPSRLPVVRELSALIDERRAELIGPIRQELLSGIADARQFAELRETLAAFVDLPLATIDYEEAAEFFNVCRARGVQGSHVDFLICAAAARHRVAVFTTDGDFDRYARLLPVKLHQARAR